MAKPTEKQRVGRLGEDIAKKYLENKGFSIIGQNYLKKYGEIDIIAKNGRVLHFIEVKTVSELPNSHLGCNENIGVSSENVPLRPRREFANSETDNYRAEDNIHKYKLKRLARVIQVYLLEKYPKGEPEWVFDAIVVRLDVRNRQAQIRFLDNIVL